MVGDDGKVQGVRLTDETEILSKIVLSNATPQVTFIDLIRSGTLPEAYLRKVESVDYSSPVTKLNGNKEPKQSLLSNKIHPPLCLFLH